jgi:hypothetical protein
MNGLASIYANDVNCDIINTIDANVSNKLTVGGDVDVGASLNVTGITNANQINAIGLNVSGNADVLGTLDVSGNVDISGNLTVVGITDTTRLQADNLILGGATYNAGVQFKMDGVANLGNRVDLNSQSRVFNIRDTNGLISIGRYSDFEPGFELRNYDPITNVLRTDVLFLGGGASEQMRATFRSPGLSNFVAWFSYRGLFDFRTPIKSEPDAAITGTGYTARFSDRFATTASNLDVVLNPNANDFSSIVQAGDNVVVASVAGKTLTLTTNNTSGCGIRMNNTISVGGATTFSNLITATSGITSNAGITANAGMAFVSGAVSTGIFKNGGDLRIDGNQANSRIVIRNKDSGGIDYASCVLATTESRFIASEFSFRNLTATTGDAYFRMTTDTNNIYIEPRAIGSNTLKNLRFITPGGSTAHLGIDSVDGSIVIATNTPATGCKLTVNGKTQTIDLDVSGNLAIPSYPNVKSTLDNFSSTTTNTTGITYTAGTDTTTIDNNLIIGNNKVFTLQDGTTQETAYNERELNDCDFHSFFSGRIILASTFNMGDAYPTSRSIATNAWFFNAIRVVKNQVYTGVGIFTTTSGSFEVAVYQKGSGGSRLALSNATTTTANVMTYIPFQATFTATTTDIAYIVFKTSSTNQFAICSQTNIAYLNLTNALGTTGTLNRRAQYSNLVGAFPATIPGTLPVSVDDANTRLAYLVLY